MSERADFRQFYRDAHAVSNLSEREKIFIGLGGCPKKSQFTSR